MNVSIYDNLHYLSDKLTIYSIVLGKRIPTNRSAIWTNILEIASKSSIKCCALLIRFFYQPFSPLDGTCMRSVIKVNDSNELSNLFCLHS